jgi:hypothetical protein
MPFLALPQMVVYVLPCLITFPCASALGKKRKRERGERGRKKKRGKRGEEKKVYSTFVVLPPIQQNDRQNGLKREGKKGKREGKGERGGERGGKGGGGGRKKKKGCTLRSFKNFGGCAPIPPL